MSRNRVIYQSEALFASKNIDSTGQADHMQLRRVQSANYSFNVSRTDLNQFGQLSRIDSLILEAPTVSADVSYFLGDGYNEEVLNFANSDLNVGFVSGQITSSSGQNLYIMTADDGKDASVLGDSTGDFGAIGIGNAFVTDYSLEASVGSFPTVTVSFEGSNINASTDVTGTKDGFSGTFTGAGIDPVSGTPLANQIYANGAVTDPVTRIGTGIQIRPSDPGTQSGVVTALRPSDILLDLEDAGGDSIANLTGAHVQSVSLSIPLSRSPIERLGTRFPFARTVDFPITPTLSVSAVLSETQQRSLTNIISNDGFIPSAQITIKDGTTANANAAVYKLTNLKLDSESFSSSIGPNKTVDLSFSISVGGPDDLENNVFFSGANAVSNFSLAPVKLNGGGLIAGQSVKVNGVVFDYEADPKTTGEQIVGYVHGEGSRSFPVTYTGLADLDLSGMLGGSVSGDQAEGGAGNTAVSIITGASGAAGGTITVAPATGAGGVYIDLDGDISGSFSLSTP